MRTTAKTDEADVSRLAAILARLPEVTTPSGYDRIDLTVLDAVYSIGIRYATVVKVLNRYLEFTKDLQVSGSVTDLIGNIERCGGPKGFAAEVRNHNVTSSRNGILKADAVFQIATILEKERIDDQATLMARHDAGDLDGVKAAWMKVPGQRSGISWRYFLILNRIEEVKPDRMVQRFVERAMGSELGINEVAVLVAAAAAQVGQTPRHVDHRIWSYERNPQRDLSIFVASEVRL
jgi:hypothetical protein